MIQVNEILKLALFHNFNILCGEQYLNNTVNATVILEYESSRIHYEGYGYGYFVLVSYFFASTNPELVNGSLKNLIQKHISAIALKIHPTEKLPADIIQLAVNNHVPILTFYDEFMEDLIININESMKTRAQYIINEEKLNLIINGTLDQDAIRKKAIEINSNFKANAITACMISKEEATNLKIHTYFDNLMYRQFNTADSYPYSFIKFGLNLILVCTFDDDELKNLSVYSHIKKLIMDSGFIPGAFFMGICDTPLNLNQLNESLMKAQTASIICKFNKADSLIYNNIGIYKYVIPLINNKIFKNDIIKKINILKEYDKIHESYLLKTLISHTYNNGDYKETSNKCFQHINTIRYRIKKAEHLLSLEESTADEEIILLIRCYLLLQALKEEKSEG